jgi:tRNA (Thr-GGU) A37 N-methylase
LRDRAALSIGCGPGHVAGETCDLAIETQWAQRADCPKRGDPEGGPDCTLVLDPRWTPALKGVETGDRMQVLYWMDRARRDLLTQSPGDDGQTMGTFALRSPNRPNPIAIS